MEANPFHDALLAEIFDAIGEGDRGDLDPYFAIVAELDPHTIIDLGSGTGVFACRLADLGTRSGAPPSPPRIARCGQGATWCSAAGTSRSSRG